MRKKWPSYFLFFSLWGNRTTLFFEKHFLNFPLFSSLCVCNIFFKPDFIEYGPKDTTWSQLQTHCHYVFNLGFTLIYRRKVVPTPICFTKKMLKLLAEKRKQSLKPKGRLLSFSTYIITKPKITTTYFSSILANATQFL